VRPCDLGGLAAPVKQIVCQKRSGCFLRALVAGALALPPEKPAGGGKLFRHHITFLRANPRQKPNQLAFSAAVGEAATV
jgi:hypothetical protein